MRARCKRHKVRGEPGLKKYPRANSPHNNTKLFFLLEIFFGDLPCKRTCHGKGRMTKMLNQNSSQLIGAFSSLTNISYILHTHFTYIPPSFSSSTLLQSLLSRIERVDGVNHHHLINPQRKSQIWRRASKPRSWITIQHQISYSTDPRRSQPLRSAVRHESNQSS